MTIDAYLAAMKDRFVTDPLVTHFQVIRERATLMDGYLRARLALADGSQLEFSEYMQRSSAGEDYGDHLQLSLGRCQQSAHNTLG
jgi:hypothetical protein